MEGLLDQFIAFIRAERGLSGKTVDAYAGDLTTYFEDLRALGLYLRHGFEVEGLRRRAVLRSGELVDEYFMGRLLDPRT